MTLPSPNLTPASGCQDHTVLPYASSIVRSGVPVKITHEVLVPRPAMFPWRAATLVASIVLRTTPATPRTLLDRNVSYYTRQKSTSTDKFQQV
jgi:hypothetical protein